MTITDSINGLHEVIDTLKKCQDGALDMYNEYVCDDSQKQRLNELISNCQKQIDIAEASLVELSKQLL